MLLLSVSLLSVAAQTKTDPVVFEIGGKKIYKSQFMRDFLKSIGKDSVSAPTACTYEKRKALEDYVELYVNFQAKLADAYAMGIDTLQALKDELSVYRNELAAPYLIDSASMQNLLREAYERNHYVLHAAHILVPCVENAAPADSLKAYNHAMELYEEALKTDNFYTVAQKEMAKQRKEARLSDNPAAEEVNPYEGDLGCFTVFDMIYPFETAVYSMKPGEISKPVRTRYGYHVIKLFDRYKFYGKVKLAHVWVSDSDPNARGRINSAYKQLENGMSFADVVKNNSDDMPAKKEGGVMPEMGCNQLPYEYVEVLANGLNVGEYSKPFHSRFGWHIIKLLNREMLPDFESVIPYYKSRMTRGERSSKPQHIFVDQCKKRYDFVDYTKVKTSKKKKAPYAASLAAVRALVTDSIFSGIFNYDSNEITDMRPLFKIGDRQYNSRQFARYMRRHKTVYPYGDLDVFVRDRYEEFINAMVLRYADDNLEKDIPEFGELINEYRHGLMIFSYNDRKIWSHAIKDSVGFQKFYDRYSTTHSYDDTNDAVYFWNHRARVNVITVADSACIKPSKALKTVNKGVAKGWSMNDLQSKLMDCVSKKKCTAEEPVKMELQVVEAGSQTLLKNSEWGKGVYPRPMNKGYQILVVEQIIQPRLKSLEEARGYYLNDYQNYLEVQNNRELRKKYNVKIYQDVIDQITY